MPDFVHLHLHTEWSILDGMIRIKDLVPRLLEYKMPGCAITDHGNLYGIIHFYKALKEAGLKPIIGCEFYMEAETFSEKLTHLVVLAKNEAGYRNLLKLASIAWLKGKKKPKIDKADLLKYSEGLIVLPGCIKGEISILILNGDVDKAVKVANWNKVGCHGRLSLFR